ncbi:acyl-CoA dehydrogenase [Thalassobius vesicularis]|uniref:3-methylmercaptopropionyl-CoA dehydrogenase n=1 Tax=Thalassobius vesicularis TaxID=1294297 RepID=A0A4S3MAD7_9RHOB|nr:acyl-CoA dehydrogenase [Thalassobius vesicularis]THD75058.1 acyl-CoA dehydrogenase [Thalassobius vesicularis]
MAYTAPLDDMLFVLEDLCGLDAIAQLPGLEEASPDMVAAILEEAGKFAGNVLSPLNVTGDQQGLGFDDGAVTTPTGWKDAYDQLVEMGWNSPTAAPDHGGMGLPQVVNACIQEMFQGANMSFQLCPMLTQGAIEAIEGYASDALKETYLPNLVSGVWTGTMNLTEPQAGSDLAAIRSKAEPEGDHYRISGQKIFITYGEHDMAENIIHLVLARLPDAPAGVKGISLFIVPKFIVNADGSLGDLNDVRCVSIEHKLGIHASPTCTLAFGDKGGAIGYLVGEANKGLQYMFAMMNNARLNVGIQGIGVAEHATQHAVAYAMERKQGGTPEGSAPTIMGHPDVRRMLGLMASRTQAARILAYRAAASLDFAHRAEDAETRAYHQRRVDFLIPVAKGWSTELGVSSASYGVQVHGGMGFVEETGAAQHLRDARITTIYEGTTGIQALDLVGRKIARDKGEAAREIIAEMRKSADALAQMTAPGADWAALSRGVAEAAHLMSETTDWLVSQNGHEPQAAAVSVLEMFGITLGAWAMGDAALHAAKRIADGRGSKALSAKLNFAGFYMTNVFPQARGLQQIAMAGAGNVLTLQSADFGV